MRPDYKEKRLTTKNRWNGWRENAQKRNKSERKGREENDREQNEQDVRAGVFTIVAERLMAPPRGEQTGLIPERNVQSGPLK